MESLRQWTNANKFETLYDSRYDEYTIEKMQRSIYNRRKVIIMIYTKDGDIFGSYHSKVSSQSTIRNSLHVNGWVWETSNDMFIFSLYNHSNPNQQPQKFTQKEDCDCCLSLKNNEKDWEYVHWLCWCVQIMKPMNVKKSFVNSLAKHFNIPNDDVLTGSSGLCNTFAVERLIIFQCN